MVVICKQRACFAMLKSFKRKLPRTLVIFWVLFSEHVWLSLDELKECCSEFLFLLFWVPFNKDVWLSLKEVEESCNGFPLLFF